MLSVLITGANRGYGFALTQLFHRMGWRVYAVVRTKQACDMLSETFADTGNCFPICADVGKEDVIEILQNYFEKKPMTLQTIINNAGIGDTPHTFESINLDEINQQINVHCFGAIRCIKALLPYVDKQEGKIINVTSRYGSIHRIKSCDQYAEHFSYAYPIAKMAQNMLTVLLSMDRNFKNIGVYGIHPGSIRSKLSRKTARLSAQEAAILFWEYFQTLSLQTSGSVYDLEKDVFLESVDNSTLRALSL